MNFVEKSIVSAISRATPDKIGVLYNTCYGGFSISKKAIDIYNKRSPENKIKYPCYFTLRHNGLLVDIYKEIGSAEFSDEKASAISVKYIDSKYTDFYDITEYDGLESVKILYHEYYLQTIKYITFDSSITNDEKNQRIIEVFKELESPPHQKKESPERVA